MSQEKTTIRTHGPLSCQASSQFRSAYRVHLIPVLGLFGEFGRRVVDAVLAVLFLTVLSPFLIIRGIVAYVRQGMVIQKTSLIGRFRIPFDRIWFADDSWGQTLPVLWNVMRGDVAFAGPRALTSEEGDEIGPLYSSRFDIRPGLCSPFTLRRNARIAYESEEKFDMEFFFKESFGGNIGLLLRSAIGYVLTDQSMTAVVAPTIKLFGISMANLTMNQALNRIILAAKGTVKSQIAFVNPDCLNIAYKDQAYSEVLRNATFVLPDGIGIHLACRLLNTSLQANVNGTDLFPRLCRRLTEEHLPMFLLGGAKGVAAETARNMKKTYPGLAIVGTRDGFFTPEDEKAVIQEINQSGARLLLVGMGAPGQEMWLAKNHSALAPIVRMGVGGLFDYYSGEVPRAPGWMREIGLEWVWRLYQEPSRLWKRYIIGNPLFLYRVWTQHKVRDTP